MGNISLVTTGSTNQKHCCDSQIVSSSAYTQDHKHHVLLNKDDMRTKFLSLSFFIRTCSIILFHTCSKSTLDGYDIMANNQMHSGIHKWNLSSGTNFNEPHCMNETYNLLIHTEDMCCLRYLLLLDLRSLWMIGTNAWLCR